MDIKTDILKKGGYDSDAVSGNGCRIVECPDVVTKEELESRLDESSVIKKVVFYDVTDSTNIRAKLAARENEESGTLFVAECQTLGRGRCQREWISPKGSGIWMSLLLRPDIKPSDAPMLTLVAAMSVRKALDDVVCEVSGEEKSCLIKWPNDIVMGKRKVCGILTEMDAVPEHVEYVVTGIGINVNTTEFDESIRDVATSIYRQTGMDIRRSDIIAGFARYFTAYYERFLETGDLSYLADEYNKYLINTGKEVKIIDADREYTAVADGIDECGRLVIKKDDGSVEKIIAGEVSVRGLYGYV